jgi:hypothetical protein
MYIFKEEMSWKTAPFTDYFEKKIAIEFLLADFLRNTYSE